MHPTVGTRPLLIALVSALIIVSATGCSRTPADSSAEAGFARDMATHHAQAVEMGFLLRDRTRDEPLRALAADIIVTQSTQRGIFMAWLQAWGLPQASPGPRMAWMSGAEPMPSMHPGQPMTGSMSPGGPATTSTPLMVGMASDEELDALRRAAGHEAEVLFLQLMIRHHQGGVLMARALLERSGRGDVTPLVRAIESGQAGETTTMTALLRERGAEPLPSLLHEDARGASGADAGPSAPRR
ncbi:MAG: DUF305 domain-containing protein [Vicinamibacterales bacterium]